MFKPLSILLLLLCTTHLFAQDNMLSFAYEGGMITHPGLSMGYHYQIGKHNGWVLQGGVKLGFYHHKGYQTAVFLTPVIQAQHISEKGFIWGLDLGGGPQRTYIPKAYKIGDAGSVSRDRSAGMMQWVFSPGIRFGKDLSERRMVPLQWFINPQLQFRKPNVGRIEKYFLLGAGVNYIL